MVEVIRYYDDKKKIQGGSIAGKIPIELEGKFGCSDIKYCYEDKNFEYIKISFLDACYSYDRKIYQVKGEKNIFIHVIFIL